MVFSGGGGREKPASKTPSRAADRRAEGTLPACSVPGPDGGSGDAWASPERGAQPGHPVQRASWKQPTLAASPWPRLWGPATRASRHRVQTVGSGGFRCLSRRPLVYLELNPSPFLTRPVLTPLPAVRSQSRVRENGPGPAASQADGRRSGRGSDGWGGRLCCHKHFSGTQASDISQSCG